MKMFGKSLPYCQTDFHSDAITQKVLDLDIFYLVYGIYRQGCRVYVFLTFKVSSSHEKSVLAILFTICPNPHKLFL